MTGEFTGNTESQTPFGVEQVPLSGFETGYGTWSVEWEGQQIEVQRTDNIWGNMQALVAQPDGFVALGLKRDGRALYFEALWRQYPRLTARIEALSRERQQKQDDVRMGGVPSDDFASWESAHRDERRYLAAQAFEATAPLVAAEDKDPRIIDR